MALLINKKCISCDMCRPECPNQAIFTVDGTYKIDSNLCTECVGYYKIPNCQKVCPIPNAIGKDPECIERKEELWNKFLSLKKIQKKISSQ